MANSRVIVTAEQINNMTMAEYYAFRLHGSAALQLKETYWTCRENWALTGDLSWLDKMLEYVNDEYRDSAGR